MTRKIRWQVSNQMSDREEKQTKSPLGEPRVIDTAARDIRPRVVVPIIYPVILIITVFVIIGTLV